MLSLTGSVGERALCVAGQAPPVSSGAVGNSRFLWDTYLIANFLLGVMQTPRHSGLVNRVIPSPCPRNWSRGKHLSPVSHPLHPFFHFR